MRVTFITVVQAFIFVLWSSIAIVARGEPIYLVVVGGQSNAEGTRTDAFELERKADIDRSIRFYWQIPGVGSSGGVWTTLVPQYGYFDAGHFGPEIGLGRRWRASTQADLAIFKFTRGDSSLKSDWRPGDSGGLFAELEGTLNSAIEQLKKGNKDGVQLKCFAWIQGESDATPEAAPFYKNNLRRLIETVRRDFGSNFRIVLGVSETHPGVLGFPIIRESQVQLAKEMTGVRAVSTLGVTTVDGTHFTPEGELKLGSRVFDACFGMF